jgi:hypothetical protein
MDGLVAYLDCDRLEDNLTPVKFGEGATATVQAGVLESGKKGLAIGLYEEASQISLRNLPTHEDASTISCWVKFKEISDVHVVTGALSEEYDFRLRGNLLVAEFRRNIGAVSASVDKKEVAPGTWFHVAATFGDENSVYFNGRLLASAQVHNKNMRRGSGRAPNVELMARHGLPSNVALDECRIYDRVLSPREVKALYDAAR